jgi:hypothetical protein
MALDKWTPVELVASPRASGHRIRVPLTAIDLDAAKRPAHLLVRVSSDRRPRLATAEWIAGVPDQTALQVSAELLADLEAPEGTYPPAEVKRASAVERLHYDSKARIAALASVVAVVGAAWGVVNEATGEQHGWIKLVVAACALAVVVLVSRA